MHRGGGAARGRLLRWCDFCALTPPTATSKSTPLSPPPSSRLRRRGGERAPAPTEKYWIGDGEGRRRTRGGVELEAPPPAMATADRTRSFMKDVKRVIIKVTNESSDWRRRMAC